MPYFRFPCHYVYWTKTETHEKDKQDIIPKILELNTNNKLHNPFSKCDVTTSISEDFQFLNQEQLRNIVFKPILNMMKETDDMFIRTLKIKNLYVTNYWFNIYKTGDFQELHDHLNSRDLISEYQPIMSIVYVLHDDNERNSLQFKLMEKTLPFLKDGTSVEFDTSKVDDIGEGSVIIFSNLLPHEVKSVKKPGRITLAFNLSYRM